MVAAEEPHTPRRRQIYGLSLLWQAAAILVVWLALIEWPLPPVGHLDPSWQEAMVDAWLHRRQFGRDFIFTYGPWGFLLARYYLPDALTIKLTFEIVGRLLLAVALVRLSTRLSALRRWLWLAGIAAFGIFFVDGAPWHA